MTEAEKSNQEKTETVEVQQERDANVEQPEVVDKTFKSEDDGINKLLREKEEIVKELETTKKRISEINEEDKSKRFKIKELTKAIETKTAREAELQDKIDKLLKEKEAKDKAWSNMKLELAKHKQEQEKIKNATLQQEENKKAELIKQAETLSKKRNDPDILKLVENANDNSTRELLLNKFRNKKVDTVKVTETSGLNINRDKPVNIFNMNIAEISKLKDTDPEAYEDILSQAEGWKWKRR